GARVVGVDGHRGRRDRRIALHGELGDGQPAREHDDDGDHPREDGAINEEPCHELFPCLLLRVGGLLLFLTGHRGIHGVHRHARLHLLHAGDDHAFAGVEASSTSQRLPMARLTRTCRASTTLSPLTTRAEVLPLASRRMACCGARMAFSRTPRPTTARTYMPGIRM